MSSGIAGRVGLIGDPVEHSLSPAFQQPAFDSLGLGVRYELWPTPSAAIPQRLAMLRSGEAFGANVTVPHKEAFYRAVDTCSARAQRAGAVNTIIARDGRLHGDNTDIHGFIVPLHERGFSFATRTVVVLGAGGAARGVLVALLEAGATRIHVVNRTHERAVAIAQELDPARITALPQAQLPRLAAQTALLVNATSIGWADTSLPLDPTLFTLLPGDAIAYDLTYRTTGFLRAAAEFGVSTIDGLPMLVHQGARSFELWTGVPAPVDLMLQAAHAARAARSG